MAKTRVKKVVVSGVTRDQMEEAFGAFAFADAKLQGINAAMDAEITKIRERNAEEIAKFQQQKDDALGGDADVRHREPGRAFLQKEKAWRRRTASSGSAPGHRSSKPARALRGAAVLELLKEFNPAYVRTSEEVAKDKLLADRENEDMPELMAESRHQGRAGRNVFVEPKKEE